MKKITTLFILIFCCTLSYGQYLSEKTIIGKWTVTKVTSAFDNMDLPESQMKEIITMKKTFHNSIFEFKKNGKFASEFAVQSSYSTGFEKLNGKNWKLNLEDELITIIDKDNEEDGSLSFGVDKYTPMADVKFSIGGMIMLHMKKGVFKTEADYETKVATSKPKEKSIEEKRKDLLGEDLYELEKTNEAKNAYQNKDIKLIEGIAYFKNSNAIVKSGKIEERYDNGDLKMEGWFLDGKKNEVWTWYYSNGQVSKEQMYQDGKLNGYSKEWDEIGQLISKVNFKDGIEAGN